MPSGRGRPVARRVAFMLPVLAAMGCTALDPEVGASQEACGVAALSGPSGSTTAYGMPSYGGYGGGGAGASPSTEACGIDAGSACDDCESKYCCSTRVACYEDPVCTCFDNALDPCVEAAGSDLSAQASCWESFRNAGTVEANRVACELAWCEVACAIPPLD